MKDNLKLSSLKVTHCFLWHFTFTHRFSKYLENYQPQQFKLLAAMATAQQQHSYIKGLTAAVIFLYSLCSRFPDKYCRPLKKFKSENSSAGLSHTSYSTYYSRLSLTTECPGVCPTRKYKEHANAGIQTRLFQFTMAANNDDDDELYLHTHIHLLLLLLQILKYCQQYFLLARILQPTKQQTKANTSGFKYLGNKLRSSNIVA
ncbi:hypothetical protein FF38_09473 [Lucilia cuprina]|uniref:Uncharacterized protein n=1 Tax=Lucilia cuprina TaxID=7375 RepID=A0A0L0C8W1_LUCCU|nr:hypothetical protein FF38_09473 [Lucilia cuprina]